MSFLDILKTMLGSALIIFLAFILIYALSIFFISLESALKEFNDKLNIERMAKRKKRIAEIFKDKEM